MDRVKNKVVLITGGAMGMGRGHSELLARDGATVVFTDRETQAGKAVAAGIRHAGGQAEFLALYVTYERQWQETVTAVVARYGRIGVHINNAAILLPKSLQNNTTEEWDRVFNVNVRGVFFGTRAVVPPMQKADRDSIINISSIYGTIGAPLACAYQAPRARCG